jgi:hypothetical protein
MRFDSLTGQEVVKTYVEAPHISNILAWPAQRGEKEAISSGGVEQESVRIHLGKRGIV